MHYSPCLLPFHFSEHKQLLGELTFRLRGKAVAWELRNSVEAVKCLWLGAILERRVKTAAVFSAKIRKSYLL